MFKPYDFSVAARSMVSLSGLKWGLDFNKAIENSGIVVVVGYGTREAIGSTV